VVTAHELARTSDGLVLKRYRQDAGDRPGREWRALRLLQKHAPGLAPEPVAVDLDVSPPFITMGEVPGQALGGQPLSLAQLRGIGAALDRLHTSVPLSALDDVFPFRPRGGTDGLARRLAAQPRPVNDPATARAYDEGLRWLAGTEADQLLTEDLTAAVLGRGDHNLSNFLWDGHQVRLVDFEYAGRCDVSGEIAELVEHISARCTPDALWQEFLEGLELSRAERARLRAARRLRAVMWLLMLFPGQPGDSRNPPGTLRKQAERTLDLLSA
jgi:hypothetical protein